MKKTMMIMVISFMAQFAFAGGSSSSGIGNPASIFCRDIGGELNIIDTPEGQVGMCTVEEWALFRLTLEDNSEKMANFGLANPASVFCRKIGGQLEIVTMPDGGQVGMCTIEENKLWSVFNSVQL